MGTQKEAGKRSDVGPVVDAVEVAISRMASATEVLQAARMAERTARSSGDPEAMDDAVYERLKAEKEFRQATAAEAQARAARAAQRRLK